VPKPRNADEANHGRSDTSRKPGGVGESFDAPFIGYINLNLTDEDKARFDEWARSASVWEVLEFQVGDGVNLSLKIDPKSAGYIASATQRRVSSPNAGLVVTARARVAETALLRVLFCLALLSHAERWTDVQSVANPDRW